MRLNGRNDHRSGPRILADFRNQDAFVAEFHRHIRLQAPPDDKRTVSDLIRLYLAAADYTGLALKTKEGYDTALARIQGKFGTMPIAALEEKGARSVIRNGATMSSLCLHGRRI